MKLFLAGLILLVGCGAMNASIIFTLGNNPSNDVNILLNTGTMGTTVQGTLNQNPNVFVNFTSTQSLLEPSNGQARVSANPEGTPLTDLSIALASGLTYGDLIINPFIGGQCPICTFGDATITVDAVDSSGVVEAPSTFTLPITNGNNFLTIVASNGEAITNTTISAAGGFNDLRQPRISGPFNPAGGSSGGSVPEPGTCGLLGSGLAGLALLAKRFRKT